MICIGSSMYVYTFHTYIAKSPWNPFEWISLLFGTIDFQVKGELEIVRMVQSQVNWHDKHFDFDLWDLAHLLQRYPLHSFPLITFR